MANAADLAESAAARVLLLGYPGGGKTGALAALANAGLKLRVLAFDKLANLQPLITFTKPEFRKNIDIVFLEDKLRGGQKSIEPSGLPKAFEEGLKMLNSWKYTDPKTGEVTDLGASKDWGPDTVVVVDSLTAMGEASMRRALAMANRTVLNKSQPVWGHAQADQYAFLEMLTSSANLHHVVVTAHLKVVGPSDAVKDDSDITRELKARTKDLVPTRVYPSALGKELPPRIAQLFGTAVLLCEAKFKNGKLIGRFLEHVPREELDLRAAALDLPELLPISDGLLTVFTATTGGPEQWFKQKENTNG